MLFFFFFCIVRLDFSFLRLASDTAAESAEVANRDHQIWLNDALQYQTKHEHEMLYTCTIHFVNTLQRKGFRISEMDCLLCRMDWKTLWTSLLKDVLREFFFLHSSFG